MNKVVLIGRLTKDIDLKAIDNQTVVTAFTLAVNRDFTNANGERQADFINCVAWKNTADILKKFTKKGSLIGVEGRIQTRQYEVEGTHKYVTEVVVERVELLDSKPKESEPGVVEEEYLETSKVLVDESSLPF